MRKSFVHEDVFGLNTTATGGCLPAAFKGGDADGRASQDHAEHVPSCDASMITDVNVKKRENRPTTWLRNVLTRIVVPPAGAGGSGHL
jgi:hypothetical protein